MQVSILSTYRLKQKNGGESDTSCARASRRYIEKLESSGTGQKRCKKNVGQEGGKVAGKAREEVKAIASVFAGDALSKPCALIEGLKGKKDIKKLKFWK